MHSSLNNPDYMCTLMIIAYELCDGLLLLLREFLMQLSARANYQITRIFKWHI